MAYGLDQCRKCGKAMRPTSPEQAIRYEASRMEKPSMPEAQWRAEGWKVAPTHYQTRKKLDGLCGECKWHAINTGSGKWKYAAIMVALAVTLGFLIVVIAT